MHLLSRMVGFRVCVAICGVILATEERSICVGVSNTPLMLIGDVGFVDPLDPTSKKDEPVNKHIQIINDTTFL